ncbi:hypothetical_protein [Candidozyma auris]|uniref:hypothetical_protein n=1 Tax=Candidozyma auris TaxID=498019 RepID=UPI0011665404|nr:hypothetical_protein [[Candida] auris]XP_054558222.1 hypothetical_protein [[Candida] auris]QEO23895.1 hypothetical_protein [[Candida] auris]QEO23953.1 hypothetical_protein [[Candida] auris]GBL52816.1 hypothetical protein CAJCM15448_50900 [[Candida] auris]
MWRHRRQVNLEAGSTTTGWFSKYPNTSLGLPSPEGSSRSTPYAWPQSQQYHWHILVSDCDEKGKCECVRSFTLFIVKWLKLSESGEVIVEIVDIKVEGRRGETLRVSASDVIMV